MDKEKIKQAIDCLETGFHWGDTKQGQKYWEKVIQNLEDLLGDK